MGLYVRVFCRAENAPTMRAALEAVNAPETVFTLEDETPLDDPNWSQINLTFTPSNSWAVLECDRKHTSDLVMAEVQEFHEQIGVPGRSAKKHTILEHLDNTHFIISCQLPFDYPEELWGAVERLMDHLVAHCDGMLQVDNVGIFLGEKLAWKED